MAESQTESSTPQSFFNLLGGEKNGAENIRILVNRFYDIMASDPRAAKIHAMHAADLTEIRQKLYEFLVGWTGGPPLYMQKYGHPRLRARHLPFSIGEQERDEWMYCMIKAMNDLQYDEALMRNLASQLYQIADFMRNREG